MGLFKLKDRCGWHAEGDRIFKSGEVVESDRPLDEMWPFKFERLRDIEGDVEASRTLQLSAKEKVAKLAAKDEADIGMHPDGHAQSAEELASISSRLGANVTAEFPEAVAAGVLVLRRGERYRLADPDLPNRSLSVGVTRDKVLSTIETMS